MPVLDIGPPRTGSTFLQKNIMSRAPEILLVHRSQGEAEEVLRMDLRRYARTNPQAAQLLRFEHEAAASARTLLVSAKNFPCIRALQVGARSAIPPKKVAAQVAALAEGHPIQNCRPPGSSSASETKRAGSPCAMQNRERIIRG